MVLRRIAASSLIEKKSTNQDRHFISVLEDGCLMGLVELSWVEQIQNSMASILQDIIFNYTTCDSSSIKEETAVNITRSIYYTLDAYTAALERPVEIISHLRDKGIRKIYAEGMNIVRSCVEDSKSLFQEIANAKLNIPLEAYNDTINVALPEFFRIYDVDFAAHDTVSSIDYPLVFDDMTSEGIFYVKQYLEKLKLETQFCSCFRLSSILQLLRGFGRKYHVDLSDTPINLFEILFDQSVVSILSGNECGQLFISRPQFTFLDEEFSVGNHQNLQIVITSVVNKMIGDFNIQSPVLIEYMHKYKELYLGRLSVALENSYLLNLVIVDGENQEDGIFIFEDGERMSDKHFVHLADMVLECEDVLEKIRLVISSVHSMGDYLDLLEADCLFDDEFLSVFEALDDIGIAVLGRLVFYEELRSGKLQLLPHKLVGFKENIESEWQSYYIEYLLKVDDNKRNNIEKIINNLRSDFDG